MHKHAGNMPRLFAGHGSKVYDFAARRLMRGVYRRIAEDIADAAPEGGHVLDVGTGPGMLPVEIATRRPDLRITAVDLSPDMVAAAERNLAEFCNRATAQVGDVAALPFADGSFDLVVATLTTHHWDDPAAGTAEIARVLRPGGRFYVYDFGFAPFDTIDETFGGRPARHTRIGTGQLHIRTLHRHVLATPVAA